MICSNCDGCDTCTVCGETFADKKYTEKEIVDLFCEQYSKLENCEPIDVLNELKRSDKSFIRMLDIFRLGINSK